MRLHDISVNSFVWGRSGGKKLVIALKITKPTKNIVNCFNVKGTFTTLTFTEARASCVSDRQHVAQPVRWSTEQVRGVVIGKRRKQSHIRSLALAHSCNKIIRSSEQERNVSNIWPNTKLTTFGCAGSALLVLSVEPVSYNLLIDKQSRRVIVNNTRG